LTFHDYIEYCKANCTPKNRRGPIIYLILGYCPIIGITSNKTDATIGPNTAYTFGAHELIHTHFDCGR